VRRIKRVRFEYKPLPSTLPAPRRARWLFAALAIPVLGAALVYILVKNPASNTPQPEPPAAQTPEPAATTASAPRGTEIDVVVERNDTLEKIFRRLKLSVTDLSVILSLPGVRQNLNQLKPGAKLSVVHIDGAVQALNHRLNETQMLAVARGSGGFGVQIVATPIATKTVRASGAIDSSLFVAASAAGVSPETILQLANDIFGWQIDFALDIRPGDRFSLIYMQKYRDGQYVGDGRIVAAEFINDGEVHRAVHYASADGRIDSYFTPDGRSVRRQFLRAPLDFRRVSSNFNPARRHPILNTIRAHRGVDYAAPTGTIVKAAGDGRVSFAGVKGSYGMAVTLEHGGGISTLYGHLSRFAKGVRTGQRVKQGETIGYVGSSGAATGPHLHYEYRVNGIHQNPRTVRLPDAAPLPAEYAADFQAKAQLLLAELERAPQTVAAAPAD